MRIRSIVLVVLVAGCGGGTNYFEVSPEEAGDELGDRACDYLYRCGSYEIDCDAAPIVTRTEASELYDSRAECDADMQEFYSDLIEACVAAGLTDDQKDLVDDCLHFDTSCMSDAELDDYAEAICSGGEPAGNEACLRAESALDACFDCLFDPESCTPA